MNNFLFTSESVTEGHPDKIADGISDSILDEIIKKDKNCRVACETLVTTGLVVVAGEITTDCYVDIPEVARRKIKDIGYISSDIGFDYNTCAVISSIDQQSKDIAQGVNKNEGLYKNQGAGDQGMMFGYACDETSEFMPMSIMFAHKLCKQLTKVRKENILDFIRPDGKAQVTIEYINGLPLRVDCIVISTQHTEDVDYEVLKKSIIREVINNVIPSHMMDEKTKFFINPTGRFVLGGPKGDCGLTGRKIIVDTYGGHGKHGGGNFHGKDPSKVDRSAAYMARHIAKNLVAAEIANKCEIQIAYAIGMENPVSLMVDFKGTGNMNEKDAIEVIKNNFDLRPAAIIEYLDLLKPRYEITSSYGHFGRTEKEFTWEDTTIAKQL